MLSLKISVLAAAAALVSLSASADGLTGAQISGSYLRWQGSGIAFFTPCANNVVIGAGVECSYSDLGNSWIADFTDTQLIIDQYVNPGYSSLPWSFELFQAGNGGLKFRSMALVSSDFPLAAPSAGVGGLKFTFYPAETETSSTFFYVNFGGVSDGGHHFQAVFDLTAAPLPEPGSYTLMLGGIAALGFVARLRSRPGR